MLKDHRRTLIESNEKMLKDTEISELKQIERRQKTLKYKLTNQILISLNKDTDLMVNLKLEFYFIEL